MCDTSVVLASATKNGEAFFAKNSDREPNEAQYLIVLPAQDYAKDEQVRCTYIEIPQVKHTYKILLSKPYWMWGAEMGANECGVAIGNERQIDELVASEKNVNTKALRQISIKSFQMEKEQFQIWNSAINHIKSDHRNTFYFKKYWRKNNQKVRIPV